MIYLISRHRGAIQWCQQQGIVVDCILSHLDSNLIEEGDTLIGTLPINLAAETQARGARYLHLSLEVPFSLRGQELSCQQLTEFGCQLQEFCVQRVEHNLSSQ